MHSPPHLLRILLPMITYQNSLEGLKPAAFEGFCVGWKTPLSGAQLLQVLECSHSYWLAMDGDVAVGFVNALSDGVLSAFIPLLEVRPEYQGQGIGKELMAKIVANYNDLYMIDLLCDESLANYYGPMGFIKVTGMAKRNFTALENVASCNNL